MARMLHFLAILACLLCAPAQSRPDIVLVLVPELTPATIKASHLAQKGMIFDHLATFPNLDSSFAAALSGLHPARTGLTGKSSEIPKTANPSHIEPPASPFSALSQPTCLPRLLAKNGYQAFVIAPEKELPKTAKFDFFTLSQTEILPKKITSSLAQIPAQNPFFLTLLLQSNLKENETSKAIDSLLHNLNSLLKSRADSCIVIVAGLCKESTTQMALFWLKQNPKSSEQSHLPIHPKSSQHHLVSLLDICPTILSISQTHYARQLDGFNLVPYLLNRPGIHRPATHIIHFPHYSPTKSFFSSYQKDDWKLIYEWENAEYKLFNLAQDPKEKTNLAHQDPRRLTEMAKTLEKKLAQFCALPPFLLPDKTPDSQQLPADAP